MSDLLINCNFVFQKLWFLFIKIAALFSWAYFMTIKLIVNTITELNKRNKPTLICKWLFDKILIRYP